MDLNNLSTGDKVAGGTGIVLLIGLLFLPWHSIDYFGGSVSRSAIESPNSAWGWLALLVTLAVVVTIVLRKLTSVELPELGSVSWPDATFYATIAVGVLLLIKLISETSSLGWGCYLAILLTAGMIYGGFLIRQEGDTGAAPSGPADPPQQF